ncbi:MAG: ferric reductase-like transmembrane domain-containing protein [Anaerolineae bacterium]|nr:ferric reductase-like transmembrane domain-containing protein [Anaerolineae bacterium]
MARLTSNWRWTALNLLAVFILIVVISQGSTDGNMSNTFDSGVESGKWAIRFLLLCLAITPLQTYFGLRSLTSLRKPAGLWAFGFAGLHGLVYFKETGWAWLSWPIQPYLALGLLGFLILTALALTSNRRAMRRLKQHWKRLHRLVYLAGSAGTTHAILVTAASKKVMVYDPQAVYELNVYLAVLVVLLGVRIPLIKRRLVGLRPQRRVERPIIPLPFSDPTPVPWRQDYKREIDELIPAGSPFNSNNRIENAAILGYDKVSVTTHLSCHFEAESREISETAVCK